LHASQQPTHLVIGQIVGPRGVRGELRVRIESDLPERFLELERVLVGPEHAPYVVQQARLHQQWALLQLEGVNDRDAAEALRGQWLWVTRDEAVPLAEHEYFVCDIVGLMVHTESGEPLGRVVEVISTGANDVYVIRTAEGELLLPAIRDVVLAVDMDAGVLRVRVPDGLR
jgi:16S rRNA processing protein RimM